MKLYVFLVSVILMFLSIRMGDWIGMILVMFGFLIMLTLAEDLED